MGALDVPDGRFAYLAPFRNQSKAIAWDPLKKFSAPVESTEENESELRVDFWLNGARAQLFGADNPQALRGMHLDGVVLDEFAQMDRAVWSEIVRPALERKNGWAIFISTPRGRNHFYQLFQYATQTPSWYADFWPASRCGTDCTPPAQIAFTPDRLADLKSEQGPDLYAQEYECSFEAAIVGAYYARQMEQIRAEGRVRTVPWQPAVPVTTFWDLGIDDSTAIIFAQRSGREVHLIDYLETSGQELAYYARELQRRPYLYAEHVLPHDGGAKELGTGKTLAHQLSDLLAGGKLVRDPDHRGRGGVDVRVLPIADVEPGIETARQLLARCWFDATKCAQLVEALSQYRRDWDSNLQAFKPKPRHDWASHGADAFRYLATGWEEDEPRILSLGHALTPAQPWDVGLPAGQARVAAQPW